jgi:SAM-dependent methyltransferase
MSTQRIIKFDEDDQVVWPICHTLIVDEDEGLVEQPSCPHILFVFANGEAFEYDRDGLETRLQAEQDKADEEEVFFRPTRVFVKWMKTHHSGKHVYEVGCGTANTANMLAKAGMHVTALDLEPRDQSEFPVVQANSTEYAFQKDSVLLFCRPCHDHDFVRNTILRGLTCGVRAVVYVGLQRNVRADLGGYYREFTKRRIAGISQADERIWEMKISRLSANAHLRRGAIPPLSD